MDYRLNQLASIEVNKKLKTSSTVADVFIYDTSLDSDGGAWREKCEGLSWYNETLNTATRGKTRKFPAVALVVAEPTSITIYDATEADLPMWMVFNNGLGTSSSWAEYHLSSYGTQKKLTMKNGQLFSATKSTDTGYYWYSALRIISFIEDAAYRVGYANKDKSIHNIEERHTASSTIESWTEVSSHGFSLVSAIHINSIEVKILPDAPIDPTTGLPKVTIFAGNIDGCYIIKDNDEVVMGGQVSSTWSVDMLFVDDYNRLWGTLSNNASFGGLQLLSEYPYNKISDIGSTTYADRKESYPRTSNDSVSVNGINANLPRILERSLTIDSKEDIFASGGTKGLTLIKDNRDNGRDSMVNYITSSYQSGWMFGDIKGAWLSDTVTTTAKTLPLKTSGEEITASDAQASDRYGSSCTLNAAGTILAVGAQLENTAATDAGKVYIYDWNGSAWVERGTIIASDAQANDYFGISCTLNSTGTILAVGAQSEDTAATDAGKVYVYDWNGSAWVERGTITASDAQTTDKFGFSCALDSTGTILAVGAYAEDTAATDAGKMYIDRKAINALSNASATEADRSLNNSNIAMFGNVAKAPVAPGADLIRYTNFSSSNYLEQSYNSDLDFGTNDFYIMGWFKGNVDGLVLLDRLGADQHGLLGAATDLTKRIYISGAATNILNVTLGTDTISTSSNAINDNEWSFLTVSKINNYTTLRINGALVAEGATTSTVGDIDHILRLGTGIPWNTSSFEGSMALWRIGNDTPSLDQINYIYNTEKELFSNGAKCTLFNDVPTIPGINNSAISATAIDSRNNKLYAGTAEGINVFDGLLRTDFINENEDIRSLSAINGILALNGPKRSKCKIEEKDLNSELRKAEEKLTKANQGYQKFWNDNLITNGGMNADTDWTKEGTWTISAGVANAVNESATDIFQDIETVIGKRYSLQFEITSYTDGNVRYSIGSFGYVAGGSLNSTGVKKVSFVATSKTTTIRIGGDTAATFSVDNVLVREVDDFDNIIYSVPSGWKPIEVIQQGLYKREGSSQDYIVSDNGFNYWVDPAIDPSLDDEICIVATRI